MRKNMRLDAYTKNDLFLAKIKKKTRFSPFTIVNIIKIKKKYLLEQCVHMKSFVYSNTAFLDRSFTIKKKFCLQYNLSLQFVQQEKKYIELTN